MLGIKWKKRVAAERPLVGALLPVATTVALLEQSLQRKGADNNADMDADSPVRFCGVQVPVGLELL